MRTGEVTGVFLLDLNELREAWIAVAIIPVTRLPPFLLLLYVKGRKVHKTRDVL